MVEYDDLKNPKRTFVIAEAGSNWKCGTYDEDLNQAKQLIKIAAKAGCDAVKFQKRTVEKVYSKEVLDSPRESPWGTTTREQKLGLEFSIKQYEEIDKYCGEKRIPWYVSCWDTDSQIDMRKFKTKFNKVASAMLIHHRLLELIANCASVSTKSHDESSIKRVNVPVASSLFVIVNGIGVGVGV